MPAYTTQSAQAELAYPGPLAQAAQGDGVKRLQEWLTLSGRGLVLNGDFGPATARALAAFQADNGLFPSATLDEGTWNALTAPMQNALDAQPDPGVPYDIAVWQVARAHMRQGAAEVGGDNRGPWVRLYARGTEGKEVQWCAYFVTFILKQTATARGSSAPLRAATPWPGRRRMRAGWSKARTRMPRATRPNCSTSRSFWSGNPPSTGFTRDLPTPFRQAPFRPSREITGTRLAKAAKGASRPGR